MEHPIERSRYIQVYQRQLEEEMEMIENGRRWRKAKNREQSHIQFILALAALFTLTLLITQTIFS